MFGSGRTEVQNPAGDDAILKSHSDWVHWRLPASRLIVDDVCRNGIAVQVESWDEQTLDPTLHPTGSRPLLSALRHTCLDNCNFFSIGHL